MTDPSERSLAGKSLVLASHNRGKLEEIAHLLAPFGVKVLSAADLGLKEPAETETTFLGNARIKAHAAAQATGLPSLADDSGIEIDALGGAPGVYSADWAETPAGRNFDLAMETVHRRLLESAIPQPHSARFRCTLVLAWPDGREEAFDGAIDGIIVWPGRGLLGHGYDPIFQPDGFGLTFGEMDRWEKNQLSHRARAFDAFAKECFT